LGIAVAAFLIIRLIYQFLQSEYESSSLDEFLVVCLGLLAPFGIRGLARSPQGLRFLICSVAYGAVILLSSYMHSYSFERGGDVFYRGLLLDLKFLMLFFGAYALALNSVRKGGSERAIGLILQVLILVALVDSIQVLRDVLGNGIDFDGDRLGVRGPFYRPEGFFHHPVPSAQVALFGFLASLTRLVKRFTPVRLGLAIYIFLMLILHVSVKEIIVGCFALMLFVLLFVRSNALTKVVAALIGLAAVGSIFASAAGSQISERISFYTGEEGGDSVRRILYSASVDIANDMMPIGSGTSTFGSQGSRTDGYSSLYFTYGVYGRWGASKENDTYLLDTFWPKILAETGYAGLFFFVMTVMVLLGAGFRTMMATRTPEDAFLFAAMFGILIISSAAAALADELTGPLFYVFGAFALARARHLLPLIRRRRKARRQDMRLHGDRGQQRGRIIAAVGRGFSRKDFA